MSTQQIELPITGMTCASCVRTVERSLKKAEGVSEVNVNLATERATITYLGDQLSVNQLIQTVEHAGYGVAQADLELPITGMTCASCVRTVERTLTKQPGVLAAHVNLATEKATVHYLPGATRRSELIKAIENAGYGVLKLEADASEDAEQTARQSEIDRQQRLVIIGAIFTLPLFVLSMMVHFHHDLPFLYQTFPWLMWPNWIYVFAALATPVYVLLGRQYIIGAYKALRNGTANMDTLIAMARV